MLKAAPSSGSDRPAPNLPSSHGEIYSSGPDRLAVSMHLLRLAYYNARLQNLSMDTVWEGEGGTNGEGAETYHYHT